VTGRTHFLGSLLLDATNLQRLPGVWVGDFDATGVGRRAMVLRPNDNNVANKSYWLSGHFTGDPRRIAFSLLTPF
jgi:hypothetical protein